MKKDSKLQRLASLVERYKRSPEFRFADLSDVNQRGLTGDTLLHAAAIRGTKDDVNTLIELGADVNAIGDIGNTPLHHTASRGNIEIAEQLLQHGANLNIKNEFGQTPLDLALLMKHTELLSLLQTKARR